MLCEMCGKDVDVVNRVRVEGSVLLLCPACAKFGTVLDAPPPAPAAPARGVPVDVSGRVARGGRRLEERDLFRELPDLELAGDWPKRVRAARERLGWTPEDLAKKLNEKKSIVLKLEAGGFHPPDTLIPKLEHLLKVRLRAEATDGPS